MSDAIYDAVRGALIQETRLTVLANNLANSRTVGFKEDRLFQTGEIVNPRMTVSADNTPTTPSAPQFPETLPVQTYTNHSQGKLEPTGNRLDLSLEGDGFFCVQVNAETQYTRKGNFTLDPDGFLVTQEGLPVMGQAGKIRLLSQNVVIDEQGNIIEEGNTVDAVKVVEIPQPGALQKVGDTRFALVDPDVEEKPAETTTVLQGFVEHANVDVLNAMAEMIDLLRGYESYQKVIWSLNETTLKAINDVGRLE